MHTNSAGASPQSAGSTIVGRREREAVGAAAASDLKGAGCKGRGAGGLSPSSFHSFLSFVV